MLDIYLNGHNLCFCELLHCLMLCQLDYRTEQKRCLLRTPKGYIAHQDITFNSVMANIHNDIFFYIHKSVVRLGNSKNV